MKIKIKVVMLPCKEKATSCIMTGVMPNIATLTKDVIDDIYDWMKFGNPHHLYFLSDEEIKVGDWCIDKNNCIYKQETDKIFQTFTNSNKIIATTDKSLELPEPSPEFIDKFIHEYNNGNTIKDVMVEYVEKIHNQYSGANAQWEEEVLKVDKNNCITITKVKDSWSREEVATLCMKIQHETTKYKQSCHYGPNTRELAEWTDNWIKENL